jgi:hypothetical protein
MKRTILFTFILLIFGSDISFCQTDDNGSLYFPLRVGNTFYYKNYTCNFEFCDSIFVVSRITHSRAFNGKNYFFCTNILGDNNYQDFYIRYDRATGNLVYLDSLNSNCNYEKVLFKLSANSGDSALNTNCFYSFNFRCTGINDTALFGLNTRLKTFYYSYGDISHSYMYGVFFSRNLGCTGKNYLALSGHSTYNFYTVLQGCKINGIVRGDTINHVTPTYADSGKYMPLAIGNRWVYFRTYTSGGGGYSETTTSKVISKITKDTLVNGKKYFYVENFAGPDPSYWVRYDALTGRLIKLTGFSLCNGDLTLYNFKYVVGDSSRADTCSGNSYVVSGIYDTVLFGTQSRTKEYSYYTSALHQGSHYETEFTKNIGPSYYMNATSAVTWYNCDTYQLTGCVLNGTVYGDTSSTIPPSYADSARYFPLAVGNKWVYLHANSIGGPYTYWTTVTTITKDTIINNKKYFLINNISFTGMTNFWIRYDSTNGHLNCFSPNESSCNYERMFYDLSDNIGDSCNNNTTSCVFNIYKCSQINDSVLFGINSRVKTYYSSYSNPSTGGGSDISKFAKNIGYLYYNHNYCGIHAQDYTYVWLMGGVVNGQVFGDTTLTNTNIIKTIVPDKFALFQNYPNPFNPKTSIKYSVPSIQYIRLNIYDILGKEVATLVNEKQSPGTYEVLFDGSMSPSGVYFYKLTAGDFSETKKMLMIK